jgi:two-component system probable response regulator PhcQ
MKRIILIDDEPNLLQALKRTLQRSLGSDEVCIELFDDPQAALKRACEVKVDLAISDYRMPQMNGVVLLKAFGVLQPQAMRLILSGSNDFDVVMAAINEAEIFKFLTKPWDDEELVETVKAALLRGAERVEERRLADQARLQQGRISAEEAERRILEAQIPGITQVKRWPDGSVMLED